MVDLNYSVGGLVSFSIATIVISTVFVCLRFWSRGISPGAKWQADDWLAVGALVPAIGVAVMVFDAQSWGLGTHVNNLSQDHLDHQLVDLYVGNILYYSSVTLSKLSAMAFYDRVFRLRTSPSRKWRWSFYGIFVLVIVWGVSAVLYSAIQCSPATKFWEPEITGTCVGQAIQFVSAAISDLIIDIIILILPMPHIFALQMDVGKRFLVAGTFLVGYVAAFVAIGRLVTYVAVGNALTSDTTYAIVPSLYWCLAVCGLSILAICLPAIFQLARRCYLYGPKALLTSRNFEPLRREKTYRGRSYVGRSTVNEDSYHYGYRSNSTRNLYHQVQLDDRANPFESQKHSIPYNFSPYAVQSEARGNIGSMGGTDYDADPLHVPLEAIHVRREVTVERGVS